MAALIFIVLLFVILVGGGWIIGKNVGGIIFKINPENNYQIKEKDNIEEKVTIANNSSKKRKNILKPNFKIPLEEIINKIETIKLQSKRNETSIFFGNLTMSEYKYLPMYYETENNNFLGISFKISSNIIFIEIAISDKSITLYKDAELLFYFENNETIKYTFSNSCIKGHNYNINLIIPKVKELELFGFQNLEYWSLRYPKKNIHIEGDNTFFDIENRMSSKKDFQEILKYLTKKIVEELISLNKNKLK